MTGDLNRANRIVKGATLCAILAASAGAAPAAPITTNTALPVSEGGLIVREQLVVPHAANDPAGLGREFDAIAGITAIGYGLTGRTALFGVIPYAYKSLDTPAGERASTGFGDASVFVRHTVLQRDAPGQTMRIAPFAGLEAPTGDHGQRDRFGLKPRAVQPGSGSVDPFGGLVFTYATTGWQLDAQAAFQNNRADEGHAAGDIARGDLSFQYRLWPANIGPGSRAFVFGVLEANLIHEEKARMNGVPDPNSGGTTLFLTPGLQYATTNWIAEAAVQIPVWQELNGTALEADHVLRFSLRRNF